MNKEVSILGAGGHTRSLINLIELNGFIISGIYDETYDSGNPEIINGHPLLGDLSALPEGPIVLSIGDNELRTLWYQKIRDKVLIESLIHPAARIENHAETGNANQVFSGAFINANAWIGDNNIINTAAIIEHEVKIGNHNHVAVGVIICGRVKIGNGCFIGAGSTIIDKVQIADNVIIGANSVVIDHIKEAGTYVGNPARRVK